MMKFSQRASDSELMDQPDIGFKELEQTYQQIAHINHLTQAYRPVLWALKYFWEQNHRKHASVLRILDIGSGYGDSLRVIYKWAKQNGISVQLTGIDCNHHAEKAAKQATPQEMKIQYLTQDVFKYQPREKYHVIINALFTHHLSDQGVLQILSWMTKHALYGWLINDLHRHWLPYYFTRYWARLFRYTRLVQHDGPLSIARSFVRSDWLRYLASANINFKQVNIRWFFPYRYAIRYEST